MADTNTAETEARDGTTDTATTQPDPTPAPTSETDEGAGSKAAVLADLATERDKRQALERDFKSLRDGLAQALGIGQQDATPEQLTEQLTAAQQETQQARAELAVYRAVPDGVDAQALLDSRAFSDKIAGLDVSNPEQVKAVIDEFVTANPRFQTLPNHSPGARDAAAGGPTPAVNGSMDDIIRGRR